MNNQFGAFMDAESKCTALIRCAFFLALSFLIFNDACAEGWVELDDSAMQDVSAQQGIAFDLEYRINSQANGDVVSASECPTVGVLTGGASCRLAFSFADSAGGWIVAKNYRGSIKLTNIRIDAVSLASAWTSRTSGSASGTGGVAAYMNPNLCINSAGCTSSSAASNYYSPLGKPSLQLTSGNWATAKAGTTSTYNSYLNQALYTDFIASIYIDRLTAEFDSSCTTSSGNTTCASKDGYLKNQISGAPISLRLASGLGYMTDPLNASAQIYGPYVNSPAKVRLDGRLQIYGFGY